MRAALLALLLLVPAANAAIGEGRVQFQEYAVEGGEQVAEPTIGIPWNTDSLFFHSGSTTIRGIFDANDNVTWSDVTPPYQVPTNLDPLLVADEDTGRVLAGGLLGPCSVMFYSDDDGNTWLPSGNMCSGAQFDHQSLGIGPKPVLGNPAGLPQLQNAYYCGQLILIGCSVSLDGGVTWTPPTPAVIQYAPIGDTAAQCGGFHGHWRISRVTGSAFLPVGACGDRHGLLVANAGLDGTEIAGLTGLTFEGRTVEGSHAWNGGFDPSIGIGRGEGWLYYGQADAAGARIALSKTEGLSWESLPDPNGPTTWLDVGQFHDPPVVKATFADVQAGDDDRVAFTFLGLEDLDGDGEGNEYPDLYGCDYQEGDEENRRWHYYAAFSYDAGANWTVHKLTDHPVQIGGVWDGGGGDPCRNLLDFNDMDLDSMGRVHIGWSDGCIDDCFVDGEHTYSREPRVLRQVGGHTLFAAYDITPPRTEVQDTDGDGISDDQDDDIDGDGIPNEDDADPARADPPTVEDTDAPGFGGLALLAALGAVMALRRRN